jgi:hypothetical protein
VVIADGAYDQDGVYPDVAARHPDAAVIVPRCTAVLSEMAATAPTSIIASVEAITCRCIGVVARIRPVALQVGPR